MRIVPGPYNILGIDNVYFELESVDAIARAITSLYAAKIAAFAKEDNKEEIRLDMEAPDPCYALRPISPEQGIRRACSQHVHIIVNEIPIMRISIRQGSEVESVLPMEVLISA
jgi:hypothetical protein